MPECSCGKYRFFSKQHAKQTARRLSQRSRVYRCGSYWHLTHWMPQQHVVYYRDRGTWNHGRGKKR